MRCLAWLGLAAVALGGAAQASECGDQIKVLDQRYRFAVTQAEPSAAPATPADAGGSGSAAAPSPGAGAATQPRTGDTGDTAISTVPNTGGVQTPTNSGVRQVSGAERERMRAALNAAMAADQSGDATGCAAKVAEARRISEGEPNGQPQAR